VRRRRSPRRMSKVPAEPEEGLTSSRRVAFIGRTKCARGLGRAISAVKGAWLWRLSGRTTAPGPGHGPSAKQSGLLDLNQMVEAGAKVEPDRRPWANVHRDPARPAGRLFHFACEIGLATAFVALEPGRCRCGSRPGAPRVRGPGGVWDAACFELDPHKGGFAMNA
jgi:hypothetical protein